MPISGFVTPYVNSENWAEMGKIRDANGVREAKKKPPGEVFAETEFYDVFDKKYDPYPSWGSDRDLPITREEIEAIFIQLCEIFGFQYDNTKNMFDYLLRLLDSRAARMAPAQALRSLHADYIGGINSNFRKWYFAAQFDIDDTLGSGIENSNKIKRSKKSLDFLEQAEKQWFVNMNSLTPTDCTIQLSLYLLCWGEASIIRYMPECLCFIFKCCNDLYYSLESDTPISNITPSFLEHAITPLYNFYRDQSYDSTEKVFHHNEKDHDQTIGYDDMNQLFWYNEGLQRLILANKKTKLMSLSPSERYLHLKEILWNKAFYKTFVERRSWSHIILNFNRVWIIHISMFWYYTAFNSPTLYTKNYSISVNNKPTIQSTLSVMSLAGSIAVLICVVSTLCEFTFVPRKWPGAQPLFKRLVFLLILLLFNMGPSVFLFWKYGLGLQDITGICVAAVQFMFSIFIVGYLSVVPLGKLFGTYLTTNSRKYLPTKRFTASFYKLKGSNKMASYGLWMLIFTSKFFESYVYLTLSVRDPIRELSVMRVTRCAGEAWIGNFLCARQPIFILTLIYVTDLALFFLDTYLWYIVWNTIFSVCRSFNIGVSIWTPWRNIFSRLPKRIYSKIIATPIDRKNKAKVLVSQVWNSIIIAMYREHLLSLDHVQKLIYQSVSQSNSDAGYILKEPVFFVSQEDQSMKSALFYQQSEAQRRITFFAQSLCTPMPEVGPVKNMPTFTVLIPHYNEKITLSLRDIIKEDDKYSNVTMLEYLKSLHPLEWTCFVRDTKQLAEEFDTETSSAEIYPKEKYDDLPYYSVGYKIATPEYVLRTRIWASLRAQTLYRTISGFMNYSRAIKLLYDVESSNLDQDDFESLEEASVMALRKFRIIVSMQRAKEFTSEEKEDRDFLLRAYPELQISYLEEEIDSTTGEKTYFSTLIDGTCSISENGERKPKYRIRLPGNPILGDGKSDNQNHAVIFCRGEYLQLVDANQDNYLEECLKIRSLLAEFEEEIFPMDPYSPDLKESEYANPVAIIGTREYIFSENIGILGDVAAGKEQTFGTLFARTLSHVGGKLHYGHPDFLNSTYMMSRGGVSKAQKGLHLNEDIYAGMNVLLRGGRIKHCEYMQCGKGRDLGFGSILNFTTKIGAGMGEQILSREYFYISTQLPLDRFLSFYYAHPGFHLNNVFIIMSIQLLLLVALNIASITSESTICEFDKFRPVTDPRRPLGCFNLIPVVQWLERCIFSIFIVFLISFIPLVVQELTERGFYKAATRLAKHFASFSPLFEVFVCKIYSQSLVSDLSMGGARYIATGRGFATSRVSFSTLYSRFASESLYYGATLGLLILYCSLVMWKFSLIYFWFTIAGLVLCPFLFNPNQYSWNEFFLDYGQYLKWLSGGNSKSKLHSWISFLRLKRSRMVGVKKTRVNSHEELRVLSDLKPSRVHLLTSEFLKDFFMIIVVFFAYSFSNSQNETRTSSPVNSLLRILIVSLGPIGVNMIILSIFFVISLLLGPLLSLISPNFPSIIAILVRTVSFVNHILFFELMWFMQKWDLSRTILGMTLSILIQCSLLNIITVALVSREFRHDKANRSWWSGCWLTSGLGWYTLTQPIREFICKVAELSYFVGDFVLGHIILFLQIPILLIPYANKWHSLMLFWLKPTRQLRPRIISKKQRQSIRLVVSINVSIFLFVVCLFAVVFTFPILIERVFRVDLEQYAPEYLADLIQPYANSSRRKGLKANTFMSQH